MEVSGKETKYTFISCHKTTGQSQYTRVPNRPFEHVGKVKHLETVVTIQNCTHEEIKTDYIHCMLATVLF